MVVALTDLLLALIYNTLFRMFPLDDPLHAIEICAFTQKIRLYLNISRLCYLECPCGIDYLGDS